jgi:hypothetical protein
LVYADTVPYVYSFVRPSSFFVSPYLPRRPVIAGHSELRNALVDSYLDQVDQSAITTFQFHPLFQYEPVWAGVFFPALAFHPTTSMRFMQ